jgi:Fe-S-cluster containining protein
MENPCIGCGVCCTQYRVAFHWSETTSHPLGTVPQELTEPLRRHEVVMKGTDAARPRCIALAGRPTVDAHCSIHGRHPSVCRAVEVGSDQCLRARKAWGMPPPGTASAR